MRWPGIEPGPNRWQRSIVPFNYQRYISIEIFCVFLMKNQRDALTGNRTRAKSLATIYCTIQLSTLEINFFFLRSGTCRDRTCDLSVNSRTRCRCAKEPHLYLYLFVCYICNITIKSLWHRFDSLLLLKN